MDNVVKSVNKSGTALTKPTIARDCVAGSTGLEPAASGVTGRRSNQTELRPPLKRGIGGRYKDRTCDLRLVRPPLSQLS